MTQKKQKKHSPCDCDECKKIDEENKNADGENQIMELRDGVFEKLTYSLLDEVDTDLQFLDRKKDLIMERRVVIEDLKNLNERLRAIRENEQRRS